jgi:Helix-turn-helix domain
MIYVDDLPSDWAVWSVDKPWECWEFQRWLRDLAPTPLPADPSPLTPPQPIRTPREMVKRAAGETITRKLYTGKETAAMLDITEAQLREFVRHGEFSYVNIGRGRLKPRRRFELDDIDKFRASRRRTEEWPKYPAASKSGPGHHSCGIGSGSVDESFMSRLKRRRSESQIATSASTTKKR